ncbi:S26 family signal peptidase [Phycisphaera mikurensis]|uniref:Signal peptidase I n=1 Tax=Phycisphaera mikurensis (strain NBRC 102666 / KCTC 22515 / FYK2301M01) TaxID=1142394 RepID=I0IGR0_PHYMF|nr:S26 family signal peptidase [Phycisphaera mikurensis]MBB6443237.1 signal peptidase I [Phycisphaera mikurensis]BAM04448.1 peptidase S26 family protein [Phycisphaera mikurensis NBRC 102666]
MRLHEPAERSLKETLESVVVAFILAFTFRVYVTEAYIIPTGSMAPTLLGSHVEADCPACGFRLVADAAPLLEHAVDEARCPMCFLEVPLAEAPGLPPAVRAGDRILVQKHLGRFESPRRYDVLVFKNPQNPFGGGQNFIKRLTGLPGERLMLLDGNVYVADEPEEAGVPDERLRWRIARKTDEKANPRAEAIQRAVFQPVWHSRHWPGDGGTSGGVTRWACPWVPRSGRWERAAGRFRPLADPPAASTPAFTLGFDFTPVAGRPGYLRPDAIYPYNQLGYGPGDLDVFEDFRVAMTLEPAEAADRGGFGPFEATVRGTARLAAGVADVRVRFAEEHVWLESRPAGTDAAWTRLAAAGAGVGLPPLAKRPRLEFWSVDQEFSAWIDGVRVLRYRVDVGFEALLTRPGPPRPAEQRLRIGLAGPGATAAALVDLDLDRDLFHESGALGGFRGGVSRGLNGLVRRDRVEPVRLAADRFFLVGDNSPQSDDSRRWSTVDAWIRDRYFPGVPARDAAGRVPAGLLIGRAFAVYYPAAKPLRPGGAAVVPDLAAMRWID